MVCHRKFLFLPRMEIPSISSSGAPRTVAAGFFLAVSLCASFSAQPNQAGSIVRSESSLPATESFAQWLEQQRNSGPRGFTNPQETATGLRLAKARAAELRALMEKDPEQFVHRAMPASDREKLPPALQTFVE